MNLESMMKERDKQERFDYENRKSYSSRYEAIQRNDELDYEITHILMS